MDVKKEPNCDYSREYLSFIEEHLCSDSPTIKVEEPDCLDQNIQFKVEPNALESCNSLVSPTIEFINIKEEIDVESNVQLLSENISPQTKSGDFDKPPSHSESKRYLSIPIRNPQSCLVYLKNFSSPKSRKIHESLNFHKRCEICRFCGKFYTNKYEYFSHLFMHSILKTQKRRLYREPVTKYVGNSVETKLKCEKCLEQFSQKIEFENHVGQCQCFKCQVCLVKFKDLDILSRHISVNATKNPYRCEKCFKHFTLSCHQYTTCIPNCAKFVSTGTEPIEYITSLEDETMKCKICFKQFTRKSNFAAHVRHHTDKKSFKCELCIKQFTQKRYLKLHVRRHSGVKRYQCEICSKQFREKCYFDTHLRTHKDEKPYACEICLKQFASRPYLNSHMLSHALKKPCECAICFKQFTRNGNLVAHMRRHTEKKSFKCDMCVKQFTEKRYLRVHMRSHSGEKRYECDICTKRFADRCYLKTHLRTHNDEKPYVCEVCLKPFAAKAYLNYHMRNHTGKKPFKCDICFKQFTRKSRFDCHVSRHSDENQHTCQICFRQFKNKNNLTCHMRYHSSEEPTIKCDFCPKLFTRKGYLKIHLRSHRNCEEKY